MIASLLVIGAHLHGVQPITAQSRQAEHLASGMTRKYVIARLGPAT